MHEAGAYQQSYANNCLYVIINLQKFFECRRANFLGHKLLISENDSNAALDKTGGSSVMKNIYLKFLHNEDENCENGQYLIIHRKKETSYKQVLNI